MKNTAGAIVASGDFIQTPRGNQVTVRLVYRFKDGSMDDDVALGKQPPDIHVWVSSGEASAFVRADLPLSINGPLFRTELASPSWR